MKNVHYIVKPENNLVVCAIVIPHKYGCDEKYYGIAKCSTEDTFDEEIGKRIAYLRALKKRKRAVIKEIREDMESEIRIFNETQESIMNMNSKINKILVKIAKIDEEIEGVIKES